MKTLWRPLCAPNWGIVATIGLLLMGLISHAQQSVIGGSGGQATNAIGNLNGNGTNTTLKGATVITGSLNLTGVSNNLSGRIFYVSTNGNDSTALMGRVDKPYLTITNAAIAASPNDLVYVNCGTYFDYDILRKGVNYYFQPGTLVNPTNVNRAIMDDRFLGATTNIIMAEGVTFRADYWTNNVPGVVILTNPATVIPKMVALDVIGSQVNNWDDSDQTGTPPVPPKPNFTSFNCINVLGCRYANIQIHSSYNTLVTNQFLMGKNEFDEDVFATSTLINGANWSFGEFHLTADALTNGLNLNQGRMQTDLVEAKVGVLDGTLLLSALTNNTDLHVTVGTFYRTILANNRGTISFTFDSWYPTANSRPIETANGFATGAVMTVSGNLLQLSGVSGQEQMWVQFTGNGTLICNIKNYNDLMTGEADDEGMILNESTGIGTLILNGGVVNPANQSVIEHFGGTTIVNGMTINPPQTNNSKNFPVLRTVLQDKTTVYVAGAGSNTVNGTYIQKSATVWTNSTAAFGLNYDGGNIMRITNGAGVVLYAADRATIFSSGIIYNQTWTNSAGANPAPTAFYGTNYTAGSGLSLVNCILNGPASQTNNIVGALATSFGQIGFQRIAATVGVIGCQSSTNIGTEITLSPNGGLFTVGGVSLNDRTTNGYSVLNTNGATSYYYFDVNSVMRTHGSPDTQSIPTTQWGTVSAAVTNTSTNAVYTIKVSDIAALAVLGVHVLTNNVITSP